MKKIAIIITIIAMGACKGKIADISKDKLSEAVVNDSARAEIYRQLEALDNNIIIARDTTKNEVYRNIAVDRIRRIGTEFLDSVTTDNIFSNNFAERLENQKQLIISNCRQLKRNTQYTQLVTEGYKQ